MKNNPVRLYGFLLSLTHFVTLIFWNAFDLQFGLLYKLQTLSGNSWSFVPEAFTQFIQNQATGITFAYVALAFITPTLFAISLTPFRVCLSVFTLAFLVKLGIFFSSYDLMGNYHYMSHLVMAGYILTQGNLFLAQLMLVFFYFGAGLIKLNWEWISGSALLVDTFLSGIWLILACTYVIILELVLVWGVFSQNKKIKYLTLLQLLAFHLFSWHIVGFYYPSIMLLLLTVFLIYQPQSEVALFRRGKSPLWIYCYVLLFILAQLYPKLLNKNEALTAEGRLFSLNMLDAKTECLPSFQIKTADGYLYLDQPLAYAIRVRCDPLVYFNYGKKLCAEQGWTKTPSVIFNLKSKKRTDTELTWVVRNQELCDAELTYSVWRNNWVHASGNPSPQQEEYSPLTGEASHWRENPARTGESKKSVSIDAPVQHIKTSLQSGIHSAAKSSPVVFKDQWVVGSDSGWLFGFKTLENVWNDYFPKPRYGFHGSASVTNRGEFILGSYDGILHKIDGATGKRIWAEKLGGAIGSSPLIIDEQVFVSVEMPPDGSYFYSLDIYGGKTLWKTSLYPGLSHASLAFDAKNNVLVGGTNRGLLVALAKKSGQEIWKYQSQGKIIATPLIGKDRVFAITTDGVLSAHSLQEGKLLWSHKLDSGSRASPSFSTDLNILIVPLENGRIIAYNSDDGRKLWELFQPHEHVASGLITTDKKGFIYWDLCADKTLCAINIKTGMIQKKYPLPGNYSSTPAVLNDTLLITLDGSEGVWTLGSSLVQ